jgi:hypothetical protein
VVVSHGRQKGEKCFQFLLTVLVNVREKSFSLVFIYAKLNDKTFTMSNNYAESLKKVYYERKLVKSDRQITNVIASRSCEMPKKVAGGKT